MIIYKFDMEYFLKYIMHLGGACFFCLFTVRKSLRIPPLRAAALTCAYTLFHCLVSSSLEVPTYLEPLFTVIALASGGIFLMRAVNEKKSKLIFLLLLGGSLVFFIRSVWYSLCRYLGIEFGLLYCAAGILVYAVLLPAATAATGKLWKMAEPLKEAPFARLCGVSCMFISMYYLSLDLEYKEMIGILTRIAVDVFITVCAFITYWQMIVMLIKSSEAVRYEERMRSLDEHLKLQAGILREAAAHEDEIRRIRHDIRHDLTALEGILTENCLDHALAYLRERIAQVDGHTSPPVCKNMIADAICRRYMALAKENGIDADVVAAIRAETWTDGNDLAVLLGNLWENALEACKRQVSGRRFVRLRAKEDESGLKISMTNSFDGATRTRAGADGLPAFASLKRGTGEEGVGIASIRAIVKRYDGLHEFTYDSCSFCANIILYPKPSSHYSSIQAH